MERDTQKSKCGLESTGTTYKILIVLTSAFFLFPEYPVVGVVSAIASLLLGRSVKRFFLLAVAILVHEMTVIFAFTIAIIFRFYSLAAVLLACCLILVSENKTIATGLATAAITIAVMPAIAFLLKLGSVVSCAGVIYPFLICFHGFPDF